MSISHVQHLLPPTAQASVAIKVAVGASLRRFVVAHPSQPNGFKQLKTMIGNAFPELKDVSSFQLLYTDNEGDLVTMSSDMELAEAVMEAVRDEAKSIRLVVRDIVIAPLQVSVDAQDFACSSLCEAAAVTEPSPTPVATSVESNSLPIAEAVADAAPAASPRQGAHCHCPSAHPLIRFLTAHNNYYCDVCKQKAAQGAPLLGCRECDYDQCEPCTASGARPAAQSQFSEQPQAVAAAPAVSIDEQLAQLMQLGLPIEKAQRLLARFGGDVEHIRQFVLARQSGRGGRIGGWFGGRHKWGEGKLASQRVHPRHEQTPENPATPSQASGPAARPAETRASEPQPQAAVPAAAPGIEHDADDLPVMLALLLDFVENSDIVAAIPSLLTRAMALLRTAVDEKTAIALVDTLLAAFPVIRDHALTQFVLPRMLPCLATKLPLFAQSPLAMLAPMMLPQVLASLPQVLAVLPATLSQLLADLPADPVAAHEAVRAQLGSVLPPHFWHARNHFAHLDGRFVAHASPQPVVATSSAAARPATFVAAPAPQPAAVAAPEPSSELRPLQAAEGVHEGIFCNQCQQQPIQGPRFTCTVCPAFDLCTACEAKGEHPADHPLVKTRAVPRKVQHHGITCDGCGAAPIEGVRFTCTVCRDFDLCAACEAMGEHPAEHPLTQRKVAVEAHPARGGWHGRGRGWHGHGRGHGRGLGHFFRRAMQNAGEQAVLASFVPEAVAAHAAAHVSERCAMKQAKLAAKQAEAAAKHAAKQAEAAAKHAAKQAEAAAKHAAKQAKVAVKLAAHQEMSQTNDEFKQALHQAKAQSKYEAKLAAQQTKEQTNDEFKQALHQAKAQSKGEAKLAPQQAKEAAEFAAEAELAARQAAAAVAAASIPVAVVALAQTMPATAVQPYAEQLETLGCMGFREQSLNLYLLEHYRGNVLEVMNFYLENA